MKELFFLVLSASGGAGHHRAGEALKQSASKTKLPIRIEHYDCLDFTSKFFKRLYSETYLQMVNKAPELWGYLYSKAEAKPYRKKGLLEVFDYFNYRQYIKFLQASNADAILCTHFLPFISISNEVLRAGIQSPFFAATTDFDVHQYWVDPIIQRYYVYDRESAWQLQAKGVPKEKVVITGIPLMPEFATKANSSSLRTRFRLEKKAFTVLLASGGFGVGRVHEIVLSVVQAFEHYPKKTFNLMIVCGNNEELSLKVNQLSYPPNVVVKIFGFVNNMHELMDASDVLISKAGGLTSAEAMAKGLPMIIVDPIPGQESRNAGIITEHGAGWQALDYHNLRYKLERLINDPDLLRRAREATQSLAKPKAAVAILEDVYSSLQPKSKIGERT